MMKTLLLPLLLTSSIAVAENVYIERYDTNPAVPLRMQPEPYYTQERLQNERILEELEEANDIAREQLERQERQFEDDY
ncbi:MAG: hypothetical protein PHG36_07400 [Dehalococcoidia bacterium]|nr:hypothetical protein [Dehalococcoidia bacterium]